MNREKTSYFIYWFFHGNRILFKLSLPLILGWLISEQSRIGTMTRGPLLFLVVCILITNVADIILMKLGQYDWLEEE